MSLARSTLVVGFATALSRVLGFARDMLIARALGAGAVADAFFIAFRLPNLARRTLSEGALNAGFVPLYLRLKNDAGTSAASRFAADALSGFAMLLFVVVGAVEIAAGAVVLLVAGGYAGEPHTLSLATIYTRLAFPFVWGISLASLIGAILNAERRFGAAAFAPVAVNVVLIATMLLLAATPAMPQETQARWFAFAVAVSGLVHLAIVAIALLRTPLRLALAWPRLTPELRRLLVMSAPAMLASGAAQFIILAATAVASYTPSAVSWLYYAERVFQLPLGFVGSAVGLVLLSDLADRLAAGDHEGLIAAHNRALEAALLMAMPAAVALLLLAEPIAQVLFERGAFGPHDTAGTAGALLGLAAGLPLAVAGKVLLQPLFARQEFRAALLAGVLGLAVTVVAGSLLAGGLGALGIGLGAALGFTAHAGAVLLALRARGLWRPDARLFARLIRGAAASLLMAAALYAARQALPHLGGGALRVPLLAALCLGGFAIYAAAALALRAVTPGDLRGLGLRA
ncbi:MAG: murein biosynthesis integral membrane protein MurJ [Microvirga sp.]